MTVPPDKMIFSAAMVTLGSTTAASVMPSQYGGKGSFPSPKLLVGTALTFAALSMVGDATPQVAGPLAWCIAITALTYYGMPILDNWLTGTHYKTGSAAAPQKGN